MKAAGLLLAAALGAPGCGRSNASGDSPATTASAAAMPAPTAAPSSRPAPTPKETTATAADKIGTLAPGTGIAVGQKVPDIRARDLDGHEIALTSLVARGPILLAFYRGGWCPYCNFEIREMTRAFPEYQKRGFSPWRSASTSPRRPRRPTRPTRSPSP